MYLTERTLGFSNCREGYEWYEKRVPGDVETQTAASVWRLKVNHCSEHALFQLTEVYGRGEEGGTGTDGYIIELWRWILREMAYFYPWQLSLCFMCIKSRGDRVLGVNALKFPVLNPPHFFVKATQNRHWSHTQGIVQPVVAHGHFLSHYVLLLLGKRRQRLSPFPPSFVELNLRQLGDLCICEKSNQII